MDVYEFATGGYGRLVHNACIFSDCFYEKQ